jgi:hypothetical protein
MTKQSEEYVQFLAKMVEEEKTAGRVRKDVDPMLTAASTFCLYLGALTMLFRTPDIKVEAVVEMLESMTAQCLKGVAKARR